MPPKSRKMAKSVKNGSFSKKHQEIYYEKSQKIENYKILWKMAKFFAKENEARNDLQPWVTIVTQ
jgi:hypothetical protein